MDAVPASGVWASGLVSLGRRWLFLYVERSNF